MYILELLKQLLFDFLLLLIAQKKRNTFFKSARQSRLAIDYVSSLDN